MLNMDGFIRYLKNLQTHQISLSIIPISTEESIRALKIAGRRFDVNGYYLFSYTKN